MYFISLCCLIAEDKTSNTMLNNSVESRHPCHISDLRGKALSFSPLRILVVGLSYMDFMTSRYDPSIPTFCFFVKSFPCIYSEDYMVLVFSFIDVMYHIDCFCRY